MNACRHSFTLDVEHPDYERCLQCGTMHSLVAPDPYDVYTPDYWTHERGNSTVEEQVYNCEKHLEGGISKNDYICSIITVSGRTAALDIGCAPGAMLKRLKHELCFAVVDGIEVPTAWDEEIKEIAGGRVYLWHGVFPDMAARMTSGWYDLITALDVFEHSHEPDRFLAECKRLLKPGGQLILMLPLVIEGAEMPERMYHAEQHVYLHTPENLARMLCDAGFERPGIDGWTRGHEVVTAYRCLPPPLELVNYDEDGEGICLR